MIYLLAIVIDVGFGIWGALGKPWYWYLINIVLLLTASGIFNTSFIQGLTRCYSVIVLKGAKGLGETTGLALFTLILWAVCYGITRVVFAGHLQIGLFFLACAAVSLIVAFVDNQFQVALARTQAFDTMATEQPEENE